MIDVIIYSKNHYVGLGLTSLFKSYRQTYDLSVYQCQSYLSALRQVKKAKLIFYDEHEGAEQTKKQIYLIKKLNPDIKVFSLASGREYNFKNLTRTYIDKKHTFIFSPLERIIKEIQCIKWNVPALDREIDYSDKTQINISTLPRLTERESIILSLIMKGKCNARISSLLDIAPKTTSGHRRSLFRKIKVRGLVELYDYMH
ncbi:LuxR C-terminal-related transcriptional regulator [Buttiauxella selenatireducens]|uniref:LuxR C-terminal-related transcriptional regulator n=1 Tax=Buttiauxella selenatireducens TaxID=3073902 RepID=A0ABY9S7D5_9ENTR|nr:LuxR C-terminal-related transcriptional regulator [Buttiauxella sp. R73]WMY72965.1 LuxR C-terminal-related transcriptional regulator [Buttiauxella sp. R73]